MSKENINADAELYIRLFPFIAKDFVCKEDLRNLLMSFGADSQFQVFGVDDNSEALRKALLYKNYLDNGEQNLSEVIKPIIEL